MRQYGADNGEENQVSGQEGFDGGEAPIEEVVGDAAETGFVAEKNNSARNTGLILLGFLVLGGGAIAFMRFKSGPATAAAATKEQNDAKATINDFLKDGQQNVKGMQDMLVNTQAVVDQFKKHEKVEQVAVESLQANPFQFEQAKSGDPNADRIKDEQARKAKIDAEKKSAIEDAGRIQIQSILSSARAKNCLIGGTLYGEGQEVSGFTIEQINPDGVIVKRDSQVEPGKSYKFKLSIKR